ncbi:MAG: prolyl oligopeptidase family serine peptidase [Chloroflexota bacterium]
MYRIESFLSARLFLTPQAVGNQIYFVSNLSGRLSLYVMDADGSVPAPLLPPDIAMQNPHLIGGESFYVFPKLGKILVMLDHDGDENYQPVWIPIGGGYPVRAFGNALANYRVHLNACYPEKNLIYLTADSRSEANTITYQANLLTEKLIKLGNSPWGFYPTAANSSHTKVLLTASYTAGDSVLYTWQKGQRMPRLLHGTPLEKRKAGKAVAPLGVFGAAFTPEDRGLLLGVGIFRDTGSLGYLRMSEPKTIWPVITIGERHEGLGEMTGLEHLRKDRYLLSYNIDGCSWLYEGVFDETTLTMTLKRVLVGEGELANGVVEACHYDEAEKRFAVSFSTATSPTQIYTLESKKKGRVLAHTQERLLGIEPCLLSAGEEASFTSHDGLHISARLYLPAAELGFKAPYPLVYYIHGGPQSQERPDFAWFSMPLIQFLTLNGFAVFVPNVRGSSGYGLNYMKRVDRDWGGDDRLDHVHAMTEILPKDKRLDTARAAVVGRSYGGYMTLTLAGRHPELWQAAVDMFGPYDLLTFSERIPATWKPYFAIALGDPASEEGRAFLTERSPRVYLDQLACPMLVIQGKNDPRVVEQESRDLVENLRAGGKNIEYIMFENEGHDVLKFENRVACYNAITDFFKKHLTRK